MVKLHFAMVCASNMNRSMEAHTVLKRHNFKVSSFGVGGSVKLPGPTADQPNIYDFGTPYKDIHADLSRQDPELYRRNGLIMMLERNMGVKTAPQRWQETRSVPFDVVITFEMSVFDRLIDDMLKREGMHFKTMLVINIDVKDSDEESKKAAPQAMRLCQMLEGAGECWEDKVEDVLEAWFRETGRRPTYNICTS
ncbi:unnamed protein product [Pedinophyceae sp. YPF-701]|nr:unnamed protein product [Pedinophyceae sp. YPF-701]